MPPLPAISTPALAALERELRFAPREAVLRDLERAEALARDLDAGVRYPDDWVVFRITGYRPAMDAPGVVEGGALITELSAFVERLSAHARVRADELPADAFLDAAGVRARWGVSRPTLQRLRKRGLVARRVVGAGGRSELAFGLGVVEAFERTHAAAVGRARGYSRLSAAERARIERCGARYVRCGGVSLNEAAARLARRHGRSHEAIRQVLRRAAARGGEAPGMLDARRRRVLERAWRRGIDVSAMVAKTGRSEGAVRRAILVARVERLTGVAAAGALAVPGGGTAEEDGAALKTPAARTGLGSEGASDLALFVEDARRKRPAVGAEETARLAAYHALRRGAGAALAAVDALRPRLGAVDAIETRLRWASRVKAELMRSQLRLVVEGLEARLGRGLEGLGAAALRMIVAESLAAVGEAIDGFDPGRGGRLAGAANVAVDRVGARWAKEVGRRGEGRAEERLPRGVGVGDWTSRVSVWDRWLGMDPRVRAAWGAGRLAGEVGAWVGARQGWDGGPPRSLSEMGMSAAKAARVDARMTRAALAVVRAGTAGTGGMEGVGGVGGARAWP